MKKSILLHAVVVALTAMIVPQALAEKVTYAFTAVHDTRYTDIDPRLGSSLIGTVTLDTTAAPDVVWPWPYGDGEDAQWYNGNFSINITTETGFTLGTATGGGTTTFNDFAVAPWWGSWIHWEDVGSDGISRQYVDLSDLRSEGDLIANVPNPWEPAAGWEHSLLVYKYDQSTGFFVNGGFVLTSWVVIPNVPVAIVIDGFDTGILDFDYNGTPVSEILADYATTAKNHGEFVSSVKQLAKALADDDLLSGADRKTLEDAAVKSNIGK